MPPQNLRRSRPAVGQLTAQPPPNSRSICATSGISPMVRSRTWGCAVAKTRKTSSTKAWPTVLTPSKSRTTVLNCVARSRASQTQLPSSAAWVPRCRSSKQHSPQRSAPSEHWPWSSKHVVRSMPSSAFLACPSSSARQQTSPNTVKSPMQLQICSWQYSGQVQHTLAPPWALPSFPRVRLSSSTSSSGSGIKPVAPNPSLEPPRTGVALGWLAGVGHHPSSQPSAKPALSAQLKR